MFQSLLPIHILKGLDEGEFSFENKTQHGFYWWILINGCGTWAQHLIDTHCLQSHKQRIFIPHGTGVHSCIESLPSGPRWTYRVLSSNHEIKDPVYLYYHNALDHVKLLFNHPLFADNMDFSPYRLFTFSEHDVRVYTEWMSSDSNWELQVSSEHRILMSSINWLFTTGKYSCWQHIMQYHPVVG